MAEQDIPIVNKIANNNQSRTNVRQPFLALMRTVIEQLRERILDFLCPADVGWDAVMGKHSPEQLPILVSIGDIFHMAIIRVSYRIWRSGVYANELRKLIVWELGQHAVQGVHRSLGLAPGIGRRRGQQPNIAAIHLLFVTAGNEFSSPFQNG